ncbi:MAG: substrate-binding domain-containing protein [Bacillota bacterium]
MGGSPTSGAAGASREVILATTTSTQDSGLLDVLIPMFEKQTGYIVRTIAVGTGQALALGARGEADLLLCHAPAAEIELVKSGAVVNRRLVMHNDFIIVGPTSDPARIRGMKTASPAFAQIAQAGAVFVSRGDDSGTHKKEKEIWTHAGVKPAGRWYLESGSGMGQTLNIASEKQGYTLTDRATYLALKKRLALDVLVEGDGALLNIYHVMQVNPEKFPKVNGRGGLAFVRFMVAESTQQVIAEFGMKEYGEPLFFPDAGKSRE